MRRFLVALAALLVGIVLSLAGIELAVRIAARRPSPPPRSVAIREPHRAPLESPHVRALARPSPEAKPFRLVVVGDSFTWGAGIYHADTYGRRMEELLERMGAGALDVRLEMISRPGWNTTQELEAASLLVPGLRPDLILLGYCLNDVEEPQRRGNDDLMEPLERREPAGLQATLHRRSRLFRLLWERFENTRQRRAFHRYYHGLYERIGWQQSLAALEGFRRLAAEAGAPLVVAVFPIFDQPLGPTYGYRSLHQRVLGVLAERDIEAVDLLPAYQGIDPVRLAVEPFADPHPNELAHRIASQYLVHFLVREGLVPITLRQIKGFRLSLPPPQETTP